MVVNLALLLLSLHARLTWAVYPKPNMGIVGILIRLVSRLGKSAKDLMRFSEGSKQEKNSLISTVCHFYEFVLINTIA